MAKPRKRIAAIPPVPKGSDRNMSQFLQSLKEALDVRLGHRGDAGEQAVTFNDLIEGGLAGGVRVVNGHPIVDKIPFGEPEDDPALPPAKPIAFTAAGVFQGIHLLWDAPVGYSSTSYTEVWRSEEADRETAVQLGGTAGRSYFDILVGQDEEVYHYWIRHSNNAGRKGPWSDMVTATKLGDIGYQIDLLSGQISETELAQGLDSRIDLIDGPETLTGSVNQRVKQLSTQVGEQISTIEENFETRFDDTTNTLNSMYTLRIDNDGYVAGFGLSNDGNTSQFIIRADTFAVGAPGGAAYPFMVVNGEAWIDTARIREASIQSGQLGPISFGKIVKANGTPVTTVGGLLRADAIDVGNLKVAEAAEFTGDVYSNNFQSGVRGWCMLQSGYVEFNEAMIRGNLEVQSITVNGNSPFGAINVERSRFSSDLSYTPTGGYYNTDGKSGTASVTTNTISDTISEMPKGSKIRLNIYPLAIREYSVSLGASRYVEPPGDGGGGHTAYYGGTLELRNGRARMRVWVDGNQISDRTFSYDNIDHYDRGGESFSGSQSYNRDDGYSLEYVYPAYKSSSRIEARVDLTTDFDCSGNWHGLTITYTAGGLMVSGDVYRLG